MAISQTGDPTGSYFRYAFVTTAPGTTTFFFPDYPKYGVWKKSYVLTSRDFGPTVEYGISVYALEKNKMIAGDPKARAVHFFLDSDVVPLNLIGDGLLPADIDGTRQPKDDATIPIVGTQDDGAGYGATSDALNIWDLSIHWQTVPQASITFREIDASCGIRFHLPVCPDFARLPASAGDREPCAIPRHLVLPAAPNLASGLS